MNAEAKSAKAIFLEAVERHAPGQWPAFLDWACAGRPDLRGLVEALLQAHREVGTAGHCEFAYGGDLNPATTVESAPELRKTPTGTSATSWSRTTVVSCSRSMALASAKLKRAISGRDRTHQ